MKCLFARIGGRERRRGGVGVRPVSRTVRTCFFPGIAGKFIMRVGLHVLRTALFLTTFQAHFTLGERVCKISACPRVRSSFRDWQCCHLLEGKWIAPVASLSLTLQGKELCV